MTTAQIFNPISGKFDIVNTDTAEQRTVVDYVASRMNFALPIKNTTVLIDDRKPHLWGVKRLQAKFDDEGHFTPSDDIEWGNWRFDSGKIFNFGSHMIEFPDWCKQSTLHPRLKTKDKADFEYYAYNDSGEFIGGGGYSTHVINGGLHKGKIEMPLTIGARYRVEFHKCVTPIVDFFVSEIRDENDEITPFLSDNVGDVVQFDGEKWNVIDHIKAGQTLQTRYQRLRVTYHGGDRFSYDSRYITLPQFKHTHKIHIDLWKNDRYYISGDILDVQKIIDAYWQDTNKKVPIENLSVFIKDQRYRSKIREFYRNFGFYNNKQISNYYGFSEKWAARNLLDNRHLFVEGYIVATRKVKKKREKIAIKDSKYNNERNKYIELSNRVPFKITFNDCLPPYAKGILRGRI